MIHVSNFRKVKRVEDVLRVFDKVRQKLPCKLILVGDGPERVVLLENAKPFDPAPDIWTARSPRRCTIACRSLTA